MNPNNIKSGIVFILFIFMMNSCKKNEILPSPIVDYKFELLDDNLNSKNKFSEGENFNFYFEINTNDSIWKFSQFVNNDSNFFRIFRIENGNYIDLGTSYKSLWCKTILYSCGHENPFIYKIPWKVDVEINEIPNQDIYPPFCIFNETPVLPKGSYITFFDEQMEFVICGDLIDTNYEQTFYQTDLIHFEISFEIE